MQMELWSPQSEGNSNCRLGLGAREARAYEGEQGCAIQVSRGRLGRTAQRLIATNRSSLAPLRVVHILREGVLGDRKAIGCVPRSERVG